MIPFERYVKDLKEILEGVEIRSIEDVDKAVELLVLNNKEKESQEKSKIDNSLRISPSFESNRDKFIFIKFGRLFEFN